MKIILFYNKNYINEKKKDKKKIKTLKNIEKS